MSVTSKHTWFFPSKGLKALFDNEICGQLSDGAWENSAPYNHYKFWCNLNTEVGTDWGFLFDKDVYYHHDRTPAKRTGYNLLTLVDAECVDLSYRMRAFYINAELGLGLVDKDAEYLVNQTGDALTAEQVRANLKCYSSSDFWVKRLERFESLGIENLCDKMKEGLEKYSRADLIKDLRLIKKQMKVVIEAAK